MSTFQNQCAKAECCRVQAEATRNLFVIPGEVSGACTVMCVGIEPDFILVQIPRDNDLNFLVSVIVPSASCFPNVGL